MSNGQQAILNEEKVLEFHDALTIMNSAISAGQRAIGTHVLAFYGVKSIFVQCDI
jgi:hypothetical protein